MQHVPEKKIKTQSERKATRITTFDLNIYMNGERRRKTAYSQSEQSSPNRQSNHLIFDSIKRNQITHANPLSQLHKTETNGSSHINSPNKLQPRLKFQTQAPQSDTIFRRITTGPKMRTWLAKKATH